MLLKAIAMAVLLVAAYCNRGQAQVAPPTILTIDTENVIEYQGDISDPSKLATNPNVTTPVTPRNFWVTYVLGDIVAVNGQPAKGTFTAPVWQILSGPVPMPGRAIAIADTRRVSIRSNNFEILKTDGTPVGTIVTLGPNGGTPPPGSPLAQTGGDEAIVGGTGAFLGVRGQQGGARTSQTVPIFRAASMAEDPANRRKNGGGKFRWVLTVIPMTVPQIVSAASGPSVSHSSNHTLVSVSKPAVPGEILSLRAIGLGPTVPGVDPGQPFPATPPAVVNSPVEVTVNGKQAEVIAAVGVPGAVDGYQVSFRVPTDAAKGSATIQLSAAWIAGPSVTIAIQ